MNLTIRHLGSMLKPAWDFGVDAYRDGGNRGKWLGNDKAGSVSIGVRRDIV